MLAISCILVIGGFLVKAFCYHLSQLAEKDHATSQVCLMEFVTLKLKKANTSFFIKSVYVGKCLVVSLFNQHSLHFVNVKYYSSDKSYKFKLCWYKIMFTHQQYISKLLLINFSFSCLIINSINLCNIIICFTFFLSTFIISKNNINNICSDNIVRTLL
jgi:hypothetical protein